MTDAATRYWFWHEKVFTREKSKKRKGNFFLSQSDMKRHRGEKILGHSNTFELRQETYGFPCPISETTAHSQSLPVVREIVVKARSVARGAGSLPSTQLSLIVTTNPGRAFSKKFGSRVDASLLPPLVANRRTSSKSCKRISAGAKSHLLAYAWPDFSNFSEILSDAIHVLASFVAVHERREFWFLRLTNWRSREWFWVRFGLGLS